MSVTEGRLRTALGRSYHLERELGAGGMATVYLAHDLKHDRQVAIKVLRPELAAVIGADRFLSEIKTTANLQHPHILPLHDSGEADSFLYYVMPLIEGETVRDRITREKQLPIADAVRIAREVAAALDYAHRKGIVHRDIKPENILLHDGSALVADFGIALAASKAGETRMTQTGMSLGTPAYMSPEQAMGEREITARSDVYALGCVLYEMLTGEPPFTGSTAQAIVARVVTESPRPMLPQRHTIPPHIEAAVLTALEKLPADRFATAAEFADALENKGGTWTPTVAMGATRPTRLTRHTRLGLIAASAIIAVAAATAGWLIGSARRAPVPVSRYGLAFAEGQAPLGRVAITPDGSRLVYQGAGDSGQRRQLWVKRRDEYQATPLPGTTGAAGPSFSPDGQWIAFDQGRQLKKMPITGGAITTIADSALAEAGLAWLDDGTIVYVQSSTYNLMRVTEAGGPTTLLREPAPGRGLVDPSALPQGRGLIFTSCTVSCATYDVWVLDLASGESRVLLPGVGFGRYLPSGHVAYVGRDGQVFAAPIDLKSLELRVTPVPVMSGVALVNNLVQNFTVSSTGTLVMQAGSAAGASGEQHALVWVDRTGSRRPVDSSWTFRLGQAAGNVGWALSPDGKRLAIGLETSSGDDIWIKELPAGPLSRLTFDTTDDARPRWTPDGRSVMYTVRLPELRQQRADGTGDTEIVLKFAAAGVAGTINEAISSPDGRWLVFRSGGVQGASGGRDISAIRPGVDTAPVPLVAKPDVDESAAALSPDGKWLAYASDETGRSEVYVRPFPATNSGKWQVSTNGGQAPLWAHSGRELFFVDGERNMVVASVQGGATLQLGARRILFNLGDDLYLTGNEHYTPFDLSRDDQRFLMARVVRRAADPERHFLLVENWFEELKAKVRP